MKFVLKKENFRNRSKSKTGVKSLIDGKRKGGLVMRRHCSGDVVHGRVPTTRDEDMTNMHI